MAARPTWQGHLKLSLVTCPVAMYTATASSSHVSFHLINPETNNRIRMIPTDPDTGPVERSDLVKGYEVSKDEYVLFDDADFDKVKLESTKTISIDEFVDEKSIDRLYWDDPFYIVPEKGVGAEAFAVIRDAMAASGTVGISRLVMYRRERAVMLKPRGKGMVLWTLRYGDEVRDEGDYFDDISQSKPEARPLTLVRKLIGEKTTHWDPSMVNDPVQERLLDIIAAKKKGKKRPARPKPQAPQDGNVIDIMTALKKSIQAEGRRSSR